MGVVEDVSLENVADECLVRKILQGESQAFEVLVRRYADAVYGVALAYVGNRSDAEDVSQETFIRAYFRLDTLLDPTKLGAWLYQIARRTSVEWLRRRRSHLGLDESILGTGRVPRETTDLSEEREKWLDLRALLLELPTNARTVLFLRYLVDWPQKQIATFLELPLGTVESRLARARKHMRRMMAVAADELKGQRRDNDFARRVRKLIQVNPVIRTEGMVFGGEGNGLIYLNSKHPATKGQGLPIVMGIEQVHALRSAIEGKDVARPLTFDLLIKAIGELGGKVESAVVTKLKETTYHAELHIGQGERRIVLDCRPSDAINVAVRAQAPIYVSGEIADLFGRAANQDMVVELPKGWTASGFSPGDYRMGVDREMMYRGTASGTMCSIAQKPRGFATLMQMCSAGPFRGGRLRLAAYVKTEKVTGAAQLWLRADGSRDEVLALVNMNDRPIRGTHDWNESTVALDVPSNAKRIAFGVLLNGAGQVWIDDVRLKNNQETGNASLEPATHEAEAAEHDVAGTTHNIAPGSKTLAHESEVACDREPQNLDFEAC